MTRNPSVGALRSEGVRRSSRPVRREHPHGKNHRVQTCELKAALECVAGLVHIAELRKKIERDPARPKVLVTEVGVGYRLRDGHLGEL